MGEVVAKLLRQLESFAEEAQRRIEKYQKMKNDIERARSILQECATCDRLPAEDSCINCEVIKSEEDYPLVVRLIF